MKDIKKILQKIGIKCFVDYYHVFEKYKDSSSNQEIIDEFNKNKETWTKKSSISRAQKGKEIFMQGLEYDILIYIIYEANENKVLLDVKKKAYMLLTMNDFFVDNIRGEEERMILIKIRLHQLVFRRNLIKLWSKCCVTGCENVDVLIASHIKAYSYCEEKEKYDKHNGLLLSPTYDKLFDLYLISFEDNGSILISNKLSNDDLTKLKITGKEKLYKVFEENKKYLAFHRAKFKEKNSSKI